jgi:hypothetical protein
MFLTIILESLEIDIAILYMLHHCGHLFESQA